MPLQYALFGTTGSRHSETQRSAVFLTRTRVCAHALLHPGPAEMNGVRNTTMSFWCQDNGEVCPHLTCRVCARAANVGGPLRRALCPWAGRGVVGNSVPRDPENDVEVSCSERWWRFPYWHSHRRRHTRWHRVNITDIKSPYTKPNLFCAWSLAWHLPLQRPSSGETKSSFVTRVQVLPSRQANRGETEVWSISCFSKGL